MLGGPAIAVLLQTGRFDQQAADATLFALRMFALGLMGQVAFEIVARLFYAQKDTLTVLYIAVSALAVNVVLAYLLVGPLAQGGLALANSIAVTFEVLLGLWLLHRRLGGMGLGRLASTLLRTGLAASLMAIAIAIVLVGLPALETTWLGARPPIGSPMLRGLITAGLGGTVGGLVFLGAGLWLDLPHLRPTVARMRLRSKAHG